jgi:putative ABC transport system permease protein
VTRVEWKESLSVALATLASRKMRAFLTMLGVVIGVASVIGVSAIINGLNKHVEDQVRAIGSQVFFVTRFKAFTFERPTEEIRKRKYLTYEDIVALREQCPRVGKATPILTRALFFGADQANEARFQGNVVQNPILRGAQPELLDVLPVYSVGAGRFFTQEEDLHAESVCLLGNAVAESLFGRLDPIGREVRVNGLPFRVLGIFEPHQGLFGGPGVDQFVIIPYRTFVKLYPENHEVILGVSVADPRWMGAAEDEVTEVLRRRRRVPANKPNDFEISSPDLLSDLWGQLTGAIVALTLVIASIGLVVGGIGVMNIMLVSVTERTAEIGVRKAVGARREDIRAQFLLEAMAMTGLGGLLGVVLGVGLSKAVAAIFPSLPAQVSLFWTIMGMVMALAVGLFFGIYPAVKASRLEPVRCLHYE